jgi:hypothetical protein
MEQIKANLIAECDAIIASLTDQVEIGKIVRLRAYIEINL